MNSLKRFKKFEKSKLHIDEDIYNSPIYKVRKMVFDKKRRFFGSKKKSESIGKPKDPLKTLKSPGLPNKILSFQFKHS